MTTDYLLLKFVTTDRNPQKADILEIGWVRFSTGKRTSIIVQQKNCESPIIHNSLTLTGLTVSEIEHGIPLEQALEQLRQEFVNTTVIGFAITYELQILSRYQIEVPNFICLYVAMRRVYPYTKATIDSLFSTLKITCSHRYRAGPMIEALIPVVNHLNKGMRLNTVLRYSKDNRWTPTNAVIELIK